MEYSSNGKGNLGVALGAIGTGLSILSGGSSILGTATNTDNYVTKEAYDIQLQLIDAQKENAVLAADLASEKKMVEVFNAASDKINSVRDELRDEIRTVETKVDNNAASQGVINAQYGSAIALNTSQISQLFNLTQLTIPNGNIMPGWGSVTITPTQSGTTIA